MKDYDNSTLVFFQMVLKFAVLNEKVKDYPSVLTQVNSTSEQINIANLVLNLSHLS